MEKRNKKLLALGTFLIIFGVGVGTLPLLISQVKEKSEDQRIEEFFNETSSEEKPAEDERAENTISDDEETSDDIVSEENSETGSTSNNSKYCMVLEIPKIKLQKGLYYKDSKYNSIKYNIQIMQESAMPDEEKGNLILSSHRGDSSISYFDKLSDLGNGDLVSVYYKNKKYNYQVVDSYLTAKDGTIDILRDKEQTVLTMITCVKNKKSKQVVYICNLVGTEDY